MCAFTATLGLQCRSRHCGVHSNQFCRTAGCSLPLQTCMVPSDIMKLVLREEAFRSSPVQGSLCPVSGVHSVFNSRDLASTSGVTTAEYLKLYLDGSSEVQSDRTCSHPLPSPTEALECKINRNWKRKLLSTSTL